MLDPHVTATGVRRIHLSSTEAKLPTKTFETFEERPCFRTVTERHATCPPPARVNFSPLARALAFGPPVAACLIVWSCSPVQQASTPLAVAMLDRAAFDRCIAPMLIRNCSFTACHGNEGFALRVYSVGKLRAPGTANTQEARTLPLSQAENDANYQSAVAFTYGLPAPEDDWLVRKPLPASNGGFEHVGGAIYSSANDPCVQQLLAWLAGTQVDCPNPGVCQ
jgi:hypothetical protein